MTRLADLRRFAGFEPYDSYGEPIYERATLADLVTALIGEGAEVVVEPEADRRRVRRYLVFVLPDEEGLP